MFAAALHLLVQGFRVVWFADPNHVESNDMGQTSHCAGLDSHRKKVLYLSKFTYGPFANAGGGGRWKEVLSPVPSGVPARGGGMVVERLRRWPGRGSAVATSLGTACRRRLSKPAACEQQRVPGGPEVQRASMEAVALALGDELTAESRLFANYYPGICRDLDIPAEAPASRAAAIAAVRALSRKKGIIGSTSRWMSSEDTGRQTCRSRHARRFLLDAGRPAPRARPWQCSMPVRSLVRSPGAALPRASSP